MFWLFSFFLPLKTTLELQLLKINEILFSKEKHLTVKRHLFSRENFLVSSWGRQVGEICVEIVSS